MISWIACFMISLLLLAISWKPLQQPGSHGFYRFFVWEAILGLLLINAPFWFYKPFVWNQLIAWSLLILSLISLVLGVHSLRTRGKPARQRQGDLSLLGFEKTTTLVTDGVYKHIRHPLYSSLFLLAWGIFCKAPFLFAFLLALTATFFLILTAKADERECAQFFGSPYQEYKQKTKRFIPHIF